MGNVMVETYAPSTNEDYMNHRQIGYFKNKLILEKMASSQKLKQHLEKIKNQKSQHADILDKSNVLMDIEWEISTYERYSQRIHQINRALDRIDDGRFGYCEMTGEQIGLKRLEALPFTHISIEALRENET
jgi:DnaK suppressor protein